MCACVVLIHMCLKRKWDIIEKVKVAILFGNPIRNSFISAPNSYLLNL